MTSPYPCFSSSKVEGHDSKFGICSSDASYLSELQKGAN